MRWLVLAAALVLASGCLDVLAEPSGPTLAMGLLDGRVGKTLVVEVDAVEGRMPDAATLELLHGTLAGIVAKQAIVDVPPSTIPAQGGGYDVKGLLRIHHATMQAGIRHGFLHGDLVWLHILYLDGTLAGEGVVAGKTIPEEGLIAIFPDTYAHAHRLANGVSVPAVGDMEQHVLLHELGHALGLVGEGVPMLRDHMDHEHPGHSSNPDSVMFFRIPMGTDQVVSGPLGDRFDADDVADLEAARAHPDGLFIQTLPWEHA